MCRTRKPYTRKVANTIGININWAEIRDSRVNKEGKVYKLKTPRGVLVIIDSSRKAHLAIQVYRTYVHEQLCYGDHVTYGCALYIMIDRPQKQFAKLLEALDESHSKLGKTRQV